MKDIKDFPLPSFDAASGIAAIVDRIIGAIGEKNNAQREALEAELDEQVYSLYGLSESQKLILRGLEY